MHVCKTVKETGEIIREWKQQGFNVGLVPTMGALHAGHKSLIDKARTSCDKVVVSIFVNPTQFGPDEDFDKYPRTFDRDKKLCEQAGVDLIFHPDVSDMYEGKHNFTVQVPRFYNDKLCGKTRQGHFNGVATVVLKLFNITTPDYAFFGQKDLQQLIILKQMCQNLNIPAEIVLCPIIREESGLALSSRNSYLTAKEKEKAASINAVLGKIQELYTQGVTDKDKVFKQALELLDNSIRIEYLEAHSLNNLDYSDKLQHNTFIAIAVKLNNVRLIDNVIL
ncbi:MAG: pantoate--beta-alanine ligase [Candidatus Gastranaerophilales bacterium]|nr:pantoate--beta-alanine ligase [Candidatus Gastranaerophilales bacterium]